MKWYKRGYKRGIFHISDIPTCSSYNGLCHLMYNITDGDTYQVLNSHQQICSCPGRPCDTNWTDTGRSITKVFKYAGQEVEIKMSYCTMDLPDIVCRQNDVALTTRGRGPFTFEIARDFSCRCYRQMYTHKSWRLDDYNYFEYSCGKPRCGMNRTPSTECMKITYKSPNNFEHEYLCRCRRYEECIGGPLPTASNPVTRRTCQRLSNAELSRRRVIRRHYRHLRQQ
ncbi:uncharacterized protein LOC123553071 isoform X2 [Mercenaria mercenaria]|uniref:uncharacterized protein LOC123553071 isoform X2 n=1 Tax=Mercenaria mercenaria TaxID=6596 RepID=UPI00234EC116|nr:uncharacterized protein LOC123553071 isoform X2 [Mercenaria mercenaria]